MLIATKIRIYPNKVQAEKLARAFGCVRWVWNNHLTETQKVYQETGKGLSQFDMNNRLPILKSEQDWLGETHSQVLQSVSLNLAAAYSSFFKKKSKYPKFKSKHNHQSIQYPQGVKIVDDCKVYLPKIGHIKGIVHRDIIGKIKTVTVSTNPSGQYYASILTEDGEAAPEISYDGKVIGIDVGLTHLAISSDGTKFENPRHHARVANNLKRKQQNLSRKVKGSNSRNKARKLVAVVHARSANTHKDWLHKISRQIVDENQVIAVEDLNVKGMMKNCKLSKAIGDVGWGMFANMLKYKSAKAGKGFIKIGRFYPSSKTCSCCGSVQASLPLNIRSWTCGNCSTTHDRDINAAQNIRIEALRIMTVGTTVTADGGIDSYAVEVGSPIL